MEDERKTAEAPGCFYCLNIKPFIHKVWPAETKEHFRNARMEFLKGVRSVLDDRINHLASHEAKGTHVTVE
jgi:hypothetical protein